MTEQTRTFAAFEIGARERESIAGYCDLLRGRPGGTVLRWVRPEIIHITVRFFGDLDRKRLKRAQQAIRQLDGGWDRPDLQLGRPGAFPSLRRPKVLWLGIEDPQGALKALAGQVDSAIRAIGFGRADKPFVGHLTLARTKRGAPPPDLERLTAGLTPPEGPLTICSITLYRSDLKPEGPQYTPLEIARSRSEKPHPETGSAD